MDYPASVGVCVAVGVHGECAAWCGCRASNGSVSQSVEIRVLCVSSGVCEELFNGGEIE